MCIVCARGLVPADESVFARQTLEHPEFATVVNDRRALTSSSWNQNWAYATIPGVSAFISFSFETAPTEVAQGYGEAYAASFQPFTEAQVAMARAALQLWADASGITFFEVPAGQGDIRFSGNFDFSTGGPYPPSLAAAYASYPGVGGGGDVFFGSSSYAYMQIFLHEIGHALGLKHSFDGDFVLGPNDDNYSRTIMSYTSGGHPGDVLGSLDIEAIQYLYGTNARDGTHVASWSWDAATYTLTQTGRDTAEVLRGMGAGNSIIHAMGGNDFIRGSNGVDTVYGGSGDDRIESGGGDDALDGGDGNDVIYGEAGSDLLEGGAGEDQLIGGADDDTLRGGADRDMLDGGDGDDRLEGDDGNDYIATGLGVDIANGGLGNDYVAAVWRSGSSVTANGGEGTDTFFIAPLPLETAEGLLHEVVNLDLADLTGSTRISVTGFERYVVYGGALDDQLRGTAAADELRGYEGDDLIEGRAGADYMRGGVGDDILRGGEDADELHGDEGDDLLEGGAGADSLSPGEGVDTVNGSDGDDSVYAVWANGTRTTIDGGAGTDMVYLQGVRQVIGGVSVYPAMTVDLIAASASGRFVASNVESIQVTGSDFVDAIRGSDIRDVLLGQAGDDYLEGRGGQDLLRGGDGNDLLSGGALTDQLMGEAGNDVLIGGANGDFLNGGDGFDVSAYEGARRGYTYVTYSQVQGGREGGTDSLTAIEALAFVDGQLSFHRDGMAAQVMRLYDSAFNRIPDAGGFEAQLDAMEGGMSLNALAQLFVESIEFQNTYGALTERQFVEQLYRNVLDREGDEAGIQNAIAQLTGGMTRGEVLVAFSESVEHKNLTNAVLLQGLWIADEQTLIIARLYDAAWNRLPDEGGLITWRNALGAGMSLEDIADAFAGAAEFTNTYGTLTDRQFIEQLYRNVLNREADEGGIQNALNAIAGGSSRGDIMLAFSESAEHIAVTRDLWIGGVRLFGSSSAPAEAKNADAPQTLPGVEDFVPLDAVNDDALVLPGVDDALVWAKEADEALVLPGIDDGSVFVTLDHNGFDTSLDDAFHGLRNEGWLH